MGRVQRVCGQDSCAGYEEVGRKSQGERAETSPGCRIQLVPIHWALTLSRAIALEQVLVPGRRLYSRMLHVQGQITQIITFPTDDPAMHRRPHSETTHPLFHRLFLRRVRPTAERTWQDLRAWKRRALRRRLTVGKWWRLAAKSQGGEVRRWGALRLSHRPSRLAGCNQRRTHGDGGNDRRYSLRWKP